VAGQRGGLKGPEGIKKRSGRKARGPKGWGKKTLHEELKKDRSVEYLAKKRTEHQKKGELGSQFKASLSPKPSRCNCLGKIKSP